MPKFIAWCNESYADRNSILFVHEQYKNVETQLKSMEYKYRVNYNSELNEENANESDYYHPPWYFRYQNIKIKKSTSELIDQVAESLGYRNKLFALCVKRHFIRMDKKIQKKMTDKFEIDVHY